MRTTGTVTSRTVDEHGTTTVTEGGRAALSVHYRPHETLSEMVDRIVAHVHHRQVGVPVAVRTEPWSIFGLHFEFAYGAGLGLRLSSLDSEGGPIRHSEYLPTHQVTREVVGELYGRVLNHTIDTAPTRRR